MVFETVCKFIAQAGLELTQVQVGLKHSALLPQASLVLGFWVDTPLSGLKPHFKRLVWPVHTGLFRVSCWGREEQPGRMSPHCRREPQPPPWQHKLSWCPPNREVASGRVYQNLQPGQGSRPDCASSQTAGWLPAGYAFPLCIESPVFHRKRGQVES